MPAPKDPIKYREWIKNMSLSKLGKKKSIETRKRMSLCKTGKKNHEWQGDDVSYRALHFWIERILGCPDTCEDCGKSGLTGHQIHWANISGLYKRITSDWIRLCAKCHGAFDKLHGLRPRNQKIYAIS